VCPSVVVEKIPHLFVSKISKHFQGVLQKDKYGGDIPSLSHLSSSDNADNTVCHTLFICLSLSFFFYLYLIFIFIIF